MLYYPQLSSGAGAQFPVQRRTTTRTLVNEPASGDTFRMSDPGAAQVRWRLQYSCLTDDEWTAIEQLFEAAEGRLATFTFLDPTENLLMWSEDWTKPEWTADPLLQLAAGIADPLGGNNALQLTNTAQASQRVLQNIGGASWFQYCYSVYLRSDAPAVVQMVIASTGQETVTAIATGPAWTRFVKSDQLSLKQDGIGFGLELPPGIRVESFGAQVDSQAAPGDYKKTTDRAGVYSNTRFDSDSLSLTTAAPNQNSCSVTLVSNLA